MAVFSWLRRRRRVPSFGREWVARYVDERGPVVFIEGAVPGWDASALIEASPSPVVCGRPVRGVGSPSSSCPASGSSGAAGNPPAPGPGRVGTDRGAEMLWIIPFVEQRIQYMIDQIVAGGL